MITHKTPTNAAHNADTREAARRRLVKASEAWMEAEEAFLAVKAEYYDAYAALEALGNDGPVRPPDDEAGRIRQSGELSHLDAERLEDRAGPHT